METPLVFSVQGALFKTLLILKLTAMLEIFIELTNQIFWTGYAEQLATENPAGFQMELAEFTKAYKS
ncbi:hypothetical protein [Mucilaginibacter polytrichastri]|nr:hypothetical protein [Mucilaginibacter polytrichastri]SFS58606.1 hypothetical protein SAMN04487890_10228 [Mucilaginibacter polytrichastri]